MERGPAIGETAAIRGRQRLMLLVRGALPFLITVITVYAVFRVAGVENVRETIAAAGPWAPLLFVAVKAATVVFAPLSGVALYLLAEPLFGFAAGALYAFTGDMVGHTAAFALSRIYGRPLVTRLVSRSGMGRVDGLLQRLGTWQGFALTRSVLFFAADITSYAAGLTRLPLWQFVVLSIPPIVVNILVVMATGQALSTGIGLAVVVVAAIVCAVTLLLWRARRSMRRTERRGTIDRAPADA